MISGKTCWLRRKEASQYLKEHYNISRTPGTLAKQASLGGGGPKFQYVGRHPMYPVDALDEWAQAQFSKVVGSTSEHKVLTAANVNYSDEEARA